MIDLNSKLFCLQSFIIDNVEEKCRNTLFLELFIMYNLGHAQKLIY